jgi:adenylate cyclase
MPAWTRALLATLALLALGQASGLSDGLNRRVSDLHWRWRAEAAPVPFPPEILLVAIDDRTLTRLGRLRYWSRAEYARLLERLTLARAVGFDILLSEPDRDPAGDEALARAMRAHGRVVLPYHQWQEAPAVTREWQERNRALLARLPPTPAGAGDLVAVNPELLEPPLPGLLQAAAAVGYANINADFDGVHRAPRLLRRTYQDHLLMHFTVALATVAAGEPPGSEWLGGGTFQLGGRQVPLQEGALLLHPVARRGGAGRFQRLPGQPVPQISFVDALSAEPESFRGRIVLVGETATGTSDVRPSVLDPGLRGVELNAEILANLLAVPPARPLPAAAQWLLVASACTAPLWLFSRLEPRRATAGCLVTAAVMVTLLEAGFWLAELVPAWAPVVLGLFGCTLAMGVQRAAGEHAEKQQFRQRFAQYVSPKLVDRLARHPEMAVEEGTRQRVAVLFSDVRGFTGYSEQHPPEVVVRQMREYLDEMAATVDAHDGVLDKFMGDAVMALFGPFLAPANSGEPVNVSAPAVACALEMHARLAEINRRWAREGLPPFRIGIGIAAGEAVVGNIGTPRRQQFTALGDCVNLAARLETATKDLQVGILVSDAVQAEASAILEGAAEFRDRGELTVRGRERPVRAYEVLPRVSTPAAAATPDGGRVEIASSGRV